MKFTSEEKVILDLAKFMRSYNILRPHFSIVFTNGCFDVLHPGHISLLEFSKTLKTKKTYTSYSWNKF